MTAETKGHEASKSWAKLAAISNKLKAKQSVGARRRYAFGKVE
jgi:hypothetical protein